MAYLYRHIRLDTNQVFYVGIGADSVYHRAYEKDRSKRSLFWQRIKAKTDYEVEIVLDDLTWEEAKEKEIEFIQLYGRSDLNKGTLCNLTDGGDGTVGYKYSQELIEQIRAKNKGRKYPPEFGKRISKEKKGVKLSETHRLAIGKSLLGKKRLEIKGGKLVLNTQTGIYYSSIGNAAKYHNISYSTLSRHLNSLNNKTNFVLC